MKQATACLVASLACAFGQRGYGFEIPGPITTRKLGGGSEQGGTTNQAYSEPFCPRRSVHFAATLPAVMSDFAVQSESGDVAAVSPTTNMAYLFSNMKM